MNTTDTNQASKDELRMEIYSTLKSCYGDGEPGEEAILALIRTEKLKLLAEVRERVVGENVVVTRIDRKTGDDERIEAQNWLRDEQRETLAKLEAEL